MNPIGRQFPAGLFAAGALLAVAAVFLAGCATFGRPAPSALPTGAASTDGANSQRAWWKARFRITWPKGEEPRWPVDLMLADRVARPVLVAHRNQLALWRFHRRAARDNAGHRFSFLFFADRETARQVFSEMAENPLLPALQKAGMFDSIIFDDPDGKPETGVAATSDPLWPPELRTAWPYYIMGVSGLWLELIHQETLKVSAPEETVKALYAYYRDLDHRLDKIWEKDAQHALLHHLNAIFGYRPMIIRKRMRF